MTLKQLNQHAIEIIAQYPDLGEEIADYVELCVDEIEQGGSETHEIQLTYSAINDLINEHKKNHYL